MQADKIEHGQTSALSEFVVDSGSSRDRGGDRENGDRSHRRRTRSPRGDDDRDRRSSRRYDDDRSYSRRHDDDDRRRRDGRDRDHRDYRDRDNRDRRDRDRDYDRRDRGYDRHRDDRRDRDRDRDDRRGDRRGGGGGGYGRDRDDDRGRGADRGVEVFGAGNANRSPTPEGTIPISKRKRVRTGWDIKAPGFENFTAMQAKMTGIFNLPGQVRPMNASMTAESAPNAPLPELHLGSGTDMSSMAGGSAAYARQARRLYVGNITFEATEMNVAQFFNHQMRERGWANDSDAAGVQGPDPVVSVQVNHEKSYAFVEFRSAAEASAAMGFDGIVFQGQVLKIRRPKDYVGNDHSASTHIPGVVSTNVPDTPNKIFIGGLPSYLNDVQVMELLQTFGELRAFNLVKEGSTNQSKGFAFCEYVDPSITDIACQGLNGMELGDRYLVVQRAAIGANAGKQGQYSNNSETAMSMDLSKLAPSIISAATAGEAVPTRVMQMLNMVTMDDLINDQDYEDLLEDIKEECGKYGNVVDVKIPRPVLTENGKVDQKASDAIEDLMKVFVMYDDVESVKKAMMSIAGRKFGGRSVICAYADEEKMV